jgi:hypothetical protein
MGCPARLLSEERTARLDRCIPLIAESFMMNHVTPAFAMTRTEASRWLQRSQKLDTVKLTAVAPENQESSEGQRSVT